MLSHLSVYDLVESRIALVILVEVSAYSRSFRFSRRYPAQNSHRPPSRTNNLNSQISHPPNHKNKLVFRTIYLYTPRKYTTDIVAAQHVTAVCTLMRRATTVAFCGRQSLTLDSSPIRRRGPVRQRSDGDLSRSTVSSQRVLPCTLTTTLKTCPSAESSSHPIDTVFRPVAEPGNTVVA